MARAAPIFLAVTALVGCAGAPTPVPTSEAPSRFATLDGIRVHYRSFGRGRDALVFVHGWAGDMSVWRFQLPAFAGRTRVVLLDLPGHGASDKPRIAYTMDLFARSIEAVMHDGGVDRAVVIGHSLGTPVVRQFYRRFPEKTLALVAVDGALRRMFDDPGEMQKFIEPYRGPGYREAAERFIGAMFGNPGTEALRDATVATVVATPQHVMLGAFEGMADPAIWKEDRVGVPLLVINAKSPYWTADYEAFVRTLSPRVEYRVIERPGHFLMLEKPEDFNSLLLEFLRKESLPGG